MGIMLLPVGAHHFPTGLLSVSQSGSAPEAKKLRDNLANIDKPSLVSGNPMKWI